MCMCVCMGKKDVHEYSSGVNGLANQKIEKRNMTTSDDGVIRPEIKTCERV